MNEGLMEAEVKGLRKIEDDLLKRSTRWKSVPWKNADMAQVADSPSEGPFGDRGPISKFDQICSIFG